MERGQKGSRTEAAQDALVRLGLLSESSGRNKGRDGLFGPATEKALRQFQKDAGLKVTGKLDDDTEAELLDTAPEGDPDNGKLDDEDEDGESSSRKKGSRKKGDAKAKADAKEKEAIARKMAAAKRVIDAHAELDAYEKRAAEQAYQAVMAMTPAERDAAIAKAKKLAEQLPKA